MQENIKNKIKKQSKIQAGFQKFADSVDKIVGSPYWFTFSVLLVVVWFFSGFFIGFGDHWQLMINSTTTVLTFLMISLLHSSERKWEDKIEQLQNLEASKIKEIQKDTKRIPLETTSETIEGPEQSSQQ